MSQPVVLLTDNDLGDRALETELLQNHIPGVTVVSADCRTEADVLVEVDRHDPHAIVTQWAPITSRVLQQAGRCRIISRVGIGLDMVDVEAAQDLGIEVRNVAHYCTEEVATHATALALALWRRLRAMDLDVRSGRWEAAAYAPEIGRLSEATVGLVGSGRIGSLVGRAFEVWGCRVIAHDPATGTDSFPRVPLDRLMAESDVISLHLPLTTSTHHIIDQPLLAAARKRPVLVNTSRGGLVNTDEVAAALESGQLGGAGLDVFEDEPFDPDHALTRQPNTILTPHAAWCSRAALPELRRESAMNVVAALTDEQRERQ